MTVKKIKGMEDVREILEYADYEDVNDLYVTAPFEDRMFVLMLVICIFKGKSELEIAHFFGVSSDVVEWLFDWLDDRIIIKEHVGGENTNIH